MSRNASTDVAPCRLESRVLSAARIIGMWAKVGRG